MDERTSAYIKAVVDKAPPLSPGQIDRLREIFLPAQGAPRPSLAPITPRPTSKKEQESVALYRHFDADGALLYVGISNDPGGRRSGHLRNSIWADFADRDEVQWFPDRASAQEAERAAIQAEAPLFNWVHSTSAARRRGVDYLVEKGRTDLLRFGAK
jgi:hypothetical protein